MAQGFLSLPSRLQGEQEGEDGRETARHVRQLFLPLSTLSVKLHFTFQCLQPVFNQSDSEVIGVSASTITLAINDITLQSLAALLCPLPCTPH